MDFPEVAVPITLKNVSPCSRYWGSKKGRGLRRPSAASLPVPLAQDLSGCDKGSWQLQPSPF